MKVQSTTLEFAGNEDELTLGVEAELQVLERESLLLTPRAAEIINRCRDKQVDHEFFQSTLEVVTGVCKNAHEVERELQRLFSLVRNAASEFSLKLSSTGTHPLADYRDRIVTPSLRYNDLIDRNQWLIRRMAVYGMHIHIGMVSGDNCIRYNNFFIHLLPHLLSLSASSPFWQGMFTGLNSCRPTTYEALPTAGMPYLVKNWREFEKLYAFLFHSGAIHSMKDVWWDLRPSPKYGTLELRFCDEPATLAESVAIVAFVHMLAHWFKEHGDEWISEHTPIKHWVLRENKWRAIRYGLDADIIIRRNGKTKSIKEDVLEWMEKLKPYATTLAYDKHLQIITEILNKGNSAQRQRDVFAKHGNLMDVVTLNVTEFANGYPAWN